MKTRYPSRTRVAIIIDVHDESLLTTLIWARQSAHHLTRQLGDHGVLAHVARVEIDNIAPHRRPTPDATNDEDLPVIGLDFLEAVELIEILEDLAAWIDDTAAVRASWLRRTGGTYPAALLRADLLGWAQLLGTRPPFTPHPRTIRPTAASTHKSSSPPPDTTTQH